MQHLTVQDPSRSWWFLWNNQCDGGLCRGLHHQVPAGLHHRETKRRRCFYHLSILPLSSPPTHIHRGPCWAAATLFYVGFMQLSCSPHVRLSQSPASKKRFPRETFRLFFFVCVTSDSISAGRALSSWFLLCCLCVLIVFLFICWIGSAVVMA